MRFSFRWSLKTWLAIAVLAPIWLAVACEALLDRHRQQEAYEAEVQQEMLNKLVEGKPYNAYSVDGVWTCTCAEFALKKHCRHIDSWHQWDRDNRLKRQLQSGVLRPKKTQRSKKK